MRGRSAGRFTARAAGGLLVLPLVAGAGACSGSSDEPRPRPAAHRSTAAPTPVPAVPSAAWRVKVTHVAGRLDERHRQALVAGVGAAIGSYVDHAFLDGPYPRADFGRAFGVFTPGLTRRARADRALLTNAPLGPATRSVRATRRTAYLSVLAPRQRVAGVTAAVDLRFLVDQADGSQARVGLHGRLLLSRDPGRPWRIFGYDVDRSQAPPRPGSGGGAR